ncbi:MAG: GDSL family lipase [Clostridiales bacterium]|nr:GDSL family lipase [Clostridiales bacterium]
MNTFTPTWENVKPLGRTQQLEDSLWLCFSGTGAEFTAECTQLSITMAGDSAVSAPANRTRLAIEVNGLRVVDDMLDAAEKTYAVWESDAPQNLTVRIIKLSETAMSTCAIKAITTDAASIQPTPARSRRIEFIGDSITCGYGADDEVAEHSFTTATENVTHSYAYKTAQALDADYSMVSISGYGIISGYTGTGESKVTAQLLPTYYEKLGFSYAWYQGQTPANVAWDFAAYTPDLIVVNLGTNDDSYTRDDPERQEDYRAQYTEFLKVIRHNNPEARILCTLGIMGDRLYPQVEKAVAAYSGETGDTNISCMKFDVQLFSDGYSADWHPSQKTHTKAADKLTRHITQLMGW